MRRTGLVTGAILTVVTLVLALLPLLVVGGTQRGDNSPHLSIAVITDTQMGTGEWNDRLSREIHDIMKDPDYPSVDFLLHLGDLSHPWDPTWEILWQDIVNPGSGYGWKDILYPYFYIPAHHDTETYSMRPDNPYFVPDLENEFGLASPFYAFEWDNILFIGVPSGLTNVELLGKAQREWLEELTSLYHNKRTVIFTHQAVADTTYDSDSGRRTYEHFVDSEDWWKGFFKRNPQIFLYIHAHNPEPLGLLEGYHAYKYGVHFVLCPQVAPNGRSDYVAYIEIAENGVVVKLWDSLEKCWRGTVMDNSIDTGFDDTGLGWYSISRPVQDGENFVFYNHVLARGYKLQLLGIDDPELVNMNRTFRYFTEPSEAATDVWPGYEEDVNNGGERVGIGYAKNDWVTFSGVDTFATATTYETCQPCKHRDGKIPWSTTPFAVAGKPYRLRVRVRADSNVQDAMDVSVMVLGENLMHVVMNKTPVLKDLDLTPEWQWYEGTFTVPDNDEAWIVKTIWDSKQPGATCYLNEWSVTRADNEGPVTEDFSVNLNGEVHSYPGSLGFGEHREYPLSPMTMKNKLNFSVEIGGSRLGMVRLVYEDPILWSDDVSIGLNSAGGDNYNVHLEMTSKICPDNVSLCPLQSGVEVGGASPVDVKGYTAWVINKWEIPGDYIVSVPSERPPWFVDPDDEVGLPDLMQVAGHFGESGALGWIPADVDCDGRVGLSDLMLVAGHWGETR